MKVSDLSGALLDYWVLRAEGWVDDRLHDMQLTRNGEYCIAGAAPKHAAIGHYWRSPSTDWGVGGPIIESEKIAMQYSTSDGYWLARGWRNGVFTGKPLMRGATPLIAAMRAHVASVLGEEVPDV